MFDVTLTIRGIDRDTPAEAVRDFIAATGGMASTVAFEVTDTATGLKVMSASAPPVVVPLHRKAG